MHGYSFDAPEIVSWCKSLKLAKMLTDSIPHLPELHDNMFILGVTRLAMAPIKADRNRLSMSRDTKSGNVAGVKESK